jgi:hypothetical protein
MPNSVTPKLKKFAARLLASEGASGNSAQTATISSTVFRVCEKLRLPLSQLTGLAGFRSLLSRALALAGGEIAWLRAVHVRADGSLEGLEELQAKLRPDEIASGELILVARMIGLLATFIGPTVTLGLLREIWPQLEDLNI